ncbi:MAG: UDP-N-acetylmuramoyl-L-alanine--D-glutamate ligase [Erysipelotrichaceae bacterium]|nr:UDP-N-acetylmuramoyl-L-alanine--D-glutamate ligase [Erysipelotrichaceae bacterium]
MEFQNKKILVIGLARSGLAAIRLLHAIGVKDITLTEQKEVREREYLESIGVTILPQSDEVFSRPYDIVIKNPGVPPISPFIRRFKDRGVPVITEIELAYQCAKPQHYIGITGTNGKTTTTTLVYEILKKAYGDKAHVGGNIGIPLSEVVLNNNLLNEEGHYISLELSNMQLIDTDELRPEIATIVNMTPDHIDFMGGLDNYYYSKTRIYKNMKDSDLFILNTDDPVVADYTSRYPIHCPTLTFSLDRTDTDAYLKDGWMVVNGENLLELNKIKLPGRHNLQNIIIAVSACRHAGVSADDIREVIYNFKGVEHRIEFVRELNGVKYYNDSKGTNTDATITALKAFDKGVILLVGGFEKGLSMDEMKNYLGCVKQVIGFGASGRRIATDLVGDKAIVVTTLDEAVAEAVKCSESGDIVLLSPTTSSFDQYSCFEERGEHFKRIVNSL